MNTRTERDGIHWFGLACLTLIAAFGTLVGLSLITNPSTTEFGIVCASSVLAFIVPGCLVVMGIVLQEMEYKKIARTVALAGVLVMLAATTFYSSGYRVRYFEGFGERFVPATTQLMKQHEWTIVLNKEAVFAPVNLPWQKHEQLEPCILPSRLIVNLVQTTDGLQVFRVIEGGGDVGTWCYDGVLFPFETGTNKPFRPYYPSEMERIKPLISK